VALCRAFSRWLENKSLESKRIPRYLTVLDQGMDVVWMSRGLGGRGRRLVNRVIFVLGTLTWSLHLWKYRSRVSIMRFSRRAIVSVLQDWDRMAISSAYIAIWEWDGGGGISAMYRENNVVDRTAP